MIGAIKLTKKNKKNSSKTSEDGYTIRIDK
jgi:hypothetical protein